ncbi:uncharacterized protein DUF1446 [Microbacterium sp. AG1240]|uniref:acyclic terpene utilization AtuA family protein n=1 Tax=Microbacterium sp. AG1240 TaxID=2183992 RepID=UPI000EB54417|nr:acyclic terpene utilization AtuA family protein [Microbacterium sp. AG1240]RKT36085.1 uncharacterized protein DUF1446 [Microbacterium sp. AG1240]
MSDLYRIGAGAGFAGDRLDPARLLARDGALDAIVFECLAERTVGLAQQRRSSGGVGFDARTVDRIVSVAESMRSRGGIIVTNGGAADPVGAAHLTSSRLEGIAPGSVVAAVSGDDVLASIDRSQARVDGTDQTLADLGDRVVSANAYLGMAGIVDALDLGANTIITGRVSDAALFLGPLAHRFGWAPDDWRSIAEGTLVGHLLECAGQLTGGYFADGVSKTVPHLATLGFPYADVRSDGAAVYGKVDGTGGRLDGMTVLEQLLYEIDDPQAYLTPDAIVDLSAVSVDEVGPSRVSVSGARANGRPERLKVSVGVRDGFAAVASINYGGYRAVARARLAAEIIHERWQDVLGWDDEIHCEYVGHNALSPWAAPSAEPTEVQVRFSTRTLRAEVARSLVHEIEALYTNGPAGGGGVSGSITETIGIVSTFIDRDEVQTKVEMVS